MKYLITSALPYANGPLHFGHLAGAYIPADVISRHKRLQGHTVKHIGGSDEHGVAIMLNAKKAKRDYKGYVDEWHVEHKRLFDKFQIDFDFFGQTSAPYHAEEVVIWFKKLFDLGFIGPKDSRQLYCIDCKNHLPDRFVEGTCYSCGYEHARGDECPECGTWIEPEKLKNPVCKICNSKNIKEVTVTQYYLLLSKFYKDFRRWFETKNESWRKTVYPYVDSLTKVGLQDRAITRDLDWGIDVPLPNCEGKKIYVWFDAPIGYVSNMKEHLKQNGNKEDYLLDWWKCDDTTILNFIGKDNIIFHAVIFPVMCMASKIANPVSILPANQYLNLCGKQFSKSTGWYVDAEAAVDKFGVDALRYYLISILPENSDSSFTWDQLGAKVNGELANNIGNLISRAMKFVAKSFPNGLESKAFDGYLDSKIGKIFESGMKEHLEILDSIQIKRGLEKIMNVGMEANTFFSDNAPWAQIKESSDKAAVTIAYSVINILLLGIMLEPYLPELSKSVLCFYSAFVNEEIKKKLYLGDLSVIKNIFTKSFTVDGNFKMPVPKIDEKVIAALTQELNSKGA